MDSDLHLTFDAASTGSLVAQVVAWALVVLACLVAVRRPWAWPGLADGLLGLAVSATYVVDHLQVREALGGERRLGAHVFDDTLPPDLPGFVLDGDLATTLDWGRAAALTLVAIAFLAVAVLSRRGRGSSTPTDY